MKNSDVKHLVHAVIVFAILWLGSTLFPQFIRFNNIFAILPTTIIFMVIYILSNNAIKDLACKSNFESYGVIFALFLILDIIPGFVALFLTAAIYDEFWMSTPWLVALVLSVVCEVIYSTGAFVVTYEEQKGA
jgi:hypothetical protein